MTYWFHLKKAAPLQKESWSSWPSESWRGTNWWQPIPQYIAPTKNNGFAQLYAHHLKHTFHKTSDEDIYLSMGYELNRIGLLPPSQVTITSRFWNTTPEKPMWARTNKNPFNSDSVSLKATFRRIYANWNWKPVIASGDWWQPRRLYHYPLVYSASHTMN